MDGLCAEMAAVQGHAQDINFNTWASCAVTWAHILARDNLKGKKRIKVTEDTKETKTTLALTASLLKEALWNR